MVAGTGVVLLVGMLLCLWLTIPFSNIFVPAQMFCLAGPVWVVAVFAEKTASWPERARVYVFVAVALGAAAFVTSVVANVTYLLLACLYGTLLPTDGHPQICWSLAMAADPASGSNPGCTD